MSSSPPRRKRIEEIIQDGSPSKRVYNPIIIVKATEAQGNILLISFEQQDLLNDGFAHPIFKHVKDADAAVAMGGGLLLMEASRRISQENPLPLMNTRNPYPRKFLLATRNEPWDGIGMREVCTSIANYLNVADRKANGARSRDRYVLYADQMVAGDTKRRLDHHIVDRKIVELIEQLYSVDDEVQWRDWAATVPEEAEYFFSPPYCDLARDRFGYGMQPHHEAIRTLAGNPNR